MVLVDADEIGQRRVAGESGGSVPAKEGQQDLFEEQGGSDALGAADGGMRQL